MKFLLLSLAALVLVAALPIDNHQIVENYRHVTAGWTQGPRASADAPISLTFALKQRNLDVLEKLFWSVSTPGHPNYGRHVSVAQLTDLLAPNAEDLSTLLSFLSSHGIEESDGSVQFTANKDFARVKTSVKVAEMMLNTEFFQFEHKEMKATALRAVSAYSLPASVAQIVDFVGGVHRLPSQRRPIILSNSEAHLAVTPSVLRHRYNVSKDDVGSNPANMQAVAQFLDQHYSPLDLDEFWLEFGRFHHDGKIAKVVGPNHIPAGVEASLDVEYIMSLGAGIPTWFWSTGGLHEGQEPFLEWMVDISNTSTVPQVFSVSYGDDEPSLSVEYMQRINVEFQKAGVRGISLLFASGDSGATCSESNIFTPSFPASSPYVTAVGGTLFKSAVSDLEVANYISGGGFSNVFPRPSYQQSAVDSYVKNYKKMPPASFYNGTGRAYPDVAAASNNFVVVCNLVPMPGVAGTSAACPTFAGVISLVNDRRLSANKPPLGFLNPFLYQHPEMLFDVTEDCTAGCGDNMFCAIEGYDMTTGLGTPSYPAILKAAMAL